MGFWRQLRAGCRVLLRRDREDRGAQEELEHFREELTHSLEAKGMPPAQARRAAGAELGSLLAAREELRDGGWEVWASGWIDDVRYAARRLRRSPGFTATAVLTLSFGLGAVATIVAVIDGVLLKPLPYANPGRLVALTHTAPGIKLARLNMSDSFYFTYREEAKVFEDLAVWNGNWSTLIEGGVARQEPTLFVSYGFLDVLGVRPAMGRSFEARDGVPNGARTLILSHGYWQKEYGGARDVLGKSLVLDGNAHEVIGVLPRRFEFLDEKFSFLVPQRPDRGRVQLVGFGDRGIARLRLGATLAEANADAARCIPMAARKFPPNAGMPSNVLEMARVAPRFVPLREEHLGGIASTLWVLSGAVSLLLILACANVANLSLVRAEARQKEIAVRRALGAGWGRTARDIVVETLLLSVMGSLGGLALGVAAIAGLRWAGIASLPRIDSIALDARSGVATLGVGVLVGLLVGMGTAWAALRRDSRGAMLWDAMRPSSRKRKALLVTQVALAMVLLVASGLMLRSYRALHQVETGFRGPEKVQAVRISIPEGTPALEVHREIVRKFAGLPSVEAVAVVSSIPMEGGAANPWQMEGHPERTGASVKVRDEKQISPGYLASIGSGLVAGRDFTWSEIAQGVPLALVSENLAREVWGSPVAALGKRLRANGRGEWKEVVGVVKDLRNAGLMREAPTMVYEPLTQKGLEGQLRTPRNVDYLIRSPRAGSAAFVDELRRALAEVNSAVPLAKLRTLEEVYRKSMARTSLVLSLIGIAGGMALLLGMVGIYGVVAYAVARRRKDIGIRIALGATGPSVAALFLRDGLRSALFGAGIGLFAALALTRMMTALLFGVSAADPLTYAAVGLLLVGAAALASWWPARRAAAVDPIEVLRAD